VCGRSSKCPYTRVAWAPTGDDRRQPKQRGAQGACIRPESLRANPVRPHTNLPSTMLKSGFGGLGVSMLASGTQDRGFAPDRSRRIFPAGQIHSMPSFGGEVKESVPCPSLLKNPALFVNSEIAGQIPLVPSSASRVRCVSDWYTASLVVKEGSPRGEGTIGFTKPQCRINPEKRPLPLPLRATLGNSTKVSHRPTDRPLTTNKKPHTSSRLEQHKPPPPPVNDPLRCKVHATH
jgi:hypothetical protein